MLRYLHIGLSGVLVALLAGCAATGETSISAVQAASQPMTAQATVVSGQLAPLADHHLHLLSRPAAVTALREIVLPPDLNSLLRKREASWNKADPLTKLYTPSAAFMVNQTWYEGPEAISGFLWNAYTGPYLFRPNSFRVDGTKAQIAGFLLEGDGTEEPFGFFHLNLVKSAQSGWQIASEVQTFPGPVIQSTYTADQLVKDLDQAGIKRGVVVSNAYYFALSPTPSFGEYDKVRAENDWVAAQVGKYPQRLTAFCSANPLRDYALLEVERCARSGRFKGLKVHFNAAQINYQDPKDVAQARAVIELANRHRLPMIIHVRSTNDYGRKDAEVFLRQLVAAAPDVTVQIAHLWGGESFSPAALEVYADAVAAGDPAARNLYFDVSGIGSFAKSAEIPAIVAAMRKIGFGRLLYASDGPPLESWQEFRKLPLSDEEFRKIADNVAPYLN